SWPRSGRRCGPPCGARSRTTPRRRGRGCRLRYIVRGHSSPRIGSESTASRRSVNFSWEQSNVQELLEQNRLAKKIAPATCAGGFPCALTEAL
uniref:Uncharacterized protein n=1 Tax=Aegilops tauschii subsp. strangulata TaxID=200361 RepID=A0A453ECM5_AEGTS